MSNNTFFADSSNPEMIQAFQQAQQTFKYFWRELSWESRRIVPALDMACAKIAFMEETEDPDKPLVEHMWIDDVTFDGSNVSGVLINDPNEISTVENGDFVTIPLTQLSDWLFASGGKTYGGFSIHAMRAHMEDNEREEHDDAWGLDFGDAEKIEVVRDQYEKPETWWSIP